MFGEGDEKVWETIQVLNGNCVGLGFVYLFLLQFVFRGVLSFHIFGLLKNSSSCILFKETISTIS